MSAEGFASPKRKERKSSSFISGLIAQNATLAVTIQAVTDVRPGNISRYHNFNKFKIENYMKFAVSMNQPIIDMATRGIMVDRGFIDFDEVDMGWILSEAIKKYSTGKGSDHYIKMLLTFSPLAASAGYLLSGMEKEEIQLNDLKKISMEFLENTTPEDADHLFSSLYDLNLNRFNYIQNFSETKIEGSNYMLEEEVNLIEFYGLFKKDSLILSELHSEYQFSFDKGISAFDEAIQNTRSVTDAITHTFLHVLANKTPKINSQVDPHLGFRIKNEAKTIIEEGGYLSSKGKVLTGKLENEIYNFEIPVELSEIAEITATISFIALLRGDQLFK